MRKTILATLLTSAALAATLTATGTAAATENGGENGGELLVLTDSGLLLRYDADRPKLPQGKVRVTGIGSDRLIGMDVRPATGGVYALGRSGQLYSVDADSGEATAVGAPIALNGKAIGFDFNPTVDRIRLVTDSGQNLRLHPDTGAVAGTDMPLVYAVGDRNEGKKPGVAASGYTNSAAGATATALYAIDSSTNSLVLQGSVPGAPVVSPNTGQLFTVGKLGLDVAATNGFDVAGTADPASHDPGNYRGIAAVRASGLLGLPLLVDVDLRTGRASVETIVPGKPVGVAFTG